MDFEHNSAEHQEIIEEHFADISDYGFYTKLRQPDQLSTFTWGDADALGAALEQNSHEFYHTILVKKEHVNALVAEIEQVIPEVAQSLQGTWRWKNEEAVYIAVWTDPSLEHALVGVCSTLQDGWENLSTPCVVVLEAESDLCVEYTLDVIENMLRKQEQVPLDDYLSFLAYHGHDQSDPIGNVEEIINGWEYDDEFGDDPEKVLVLQGTQAWIAQQQANEINDAIGETSHVNRKQKLI